MADRSYELHGTMVLELSVEGPKLATDRDAAGLVGKALGNDASFLVVPTERLTGDFFRLKTRLAGEILHRLLLYKLRVAILGDVSQYVEKSTPFRDFVIESNRGNQLWFISSVEELGDKLLQA
jgi:hypothetical protein